MSGLASISLAKAKTRVRKCVLRMQLAVCNMLCIFSCYKCRKLLGGLHRVMFDHMNVRQFSGSFHLITAFLKGRGIIVPDFGAMSSAEKSHLYKRTLPPPPLAITIHSEFVYILLLRDVSMLAFSTYENFHRP